MPPTERFDAAYYRRFYGNHPVHDRTRIAHLATAVTSIAAWWRVPIRSVLDVGAGKGFWKDWFLTNRPRVHYHGIDISEYACRRYGHEHADLGTWQPRRRYDLVVCQSVLPYLDADATTSALITLGQACAALLLLEVPTCADLRDVIDLDNSDLDVHWRTGDWYRERLDSSFVEVGAGLWALRSRGIPLLELERSR